MALARIGITWIKDREFFFLLILSFFSLLLSTKNAIIFGRLVALIMMLNFFLQAIMINFQH